SRANVTLGEYRIPIDQLDFTGRVGEGRFDVSALKIAALDGTLQGDSQTTLNDQLNTRANLKVTGMKLEDLLASRKEGEQLKLAGTLQAEVKVDAPIKVVAAKVSKTPSPFDNVKLPPNWGNGRIDMTDGRLVNLSIFRGVTEAIQTAGKIVSLPINPGAKPK